MENELAPIIEAAIKPSDVIFAYIGNEVCDCGDAHVGGRFSQSSCVCYQFCFVVLLVGISKCKFWRFALGIAKEFPW